MSYGDYMVNRAVSNTGPIIHLNEINFLEVFKIFDNILIPNEVKNELTKYDVLFKEFMVVSLIAKFKDVAEILVNKFSLDLGEAQAIALALQEKVDYFLTDDLDARIVAKSHSIETHGTMGVILRAFREGIIDKKTTIQKIKELYTESSLFVTKVLIDHVIESIGYCPLNE